MKQLIIKLYTIVVGLFYQCFYKSIYNSRSTFFLTQIKGIIDNKIISKQTILNQSSIHINGKNNKISFKQCHLRKTNIQITGNNNIIRINPHAQLNLTTIVLRGNNCNVTIGENSTFGGTYIVCMGKYNSIQIGKNCMFAEQTEIWNSDTHPIFDCHGRVINPSKPIYIKDHVWCGKRSKILKGVIIEENAIIGMEALVTKNISPNTLNAGIPTKCIRENINWDRCFISE